MTLPKVLLFPGEKWLSAEMDRDSGSLANHFAHHVRCISRVNLTVLNNNITGVSVSL